MKNIYKSLCFLSIIILLVPYNKIKGQPKTLLLNQLKIRYLVTPPDGGDIFWKLLNHDDSGWEKATDLEELSKKITDEKIEEVWIRIERSVSPQSLNNSYFEISHSGPLEIFVNGLQWGASNKPTTKPENFIIGPRRPENLGENLYAIHFKNKSGDVLFNIKLMNSEWLNMDSPYKKPQPVIDVMMRDAEICKGGDGAYYMTGTTGDKDFMLPGPKSWLISKGIQVFRSVDLKNWKSLGYVWTFEKNGTWQNEFGTFDGRGPARGIFAPQIHYIKGKYWICYSVSHSTPGHSFGISLLYSDKPEGPYKDISPAAPITDGFDSDLFEDDDGKVYLLKQGGLIARLKDDMSGLAEPFRSLKAKNYPYIGYEGVFLFKRNGKYYLTSADWNVHSDGKTSYDSMVGIADNIYGPYGDRFCGVRFGGNNSYFKGPNNEWYATVWCYPDSGPFWQKVSILKVKFNSDGLFRPVDIVN